MTGTHRRPVTTLLGRPVGGLLACGLAGALLLAGCSQDTAGDGAGVPANPHGITSENPSGTAAPGGGASGAPGASGAGPASGSTSEGSASAGASASEAASARADQRAVGAAGERAASFGFTNQVSATETAIADTRHQARLRQTNTSGTTVDPADCKAPLTAVDWSPILMPGADASRIDFGSESFAGTGTVEVASLEDAAVVREHRENVERLVADCAELSMTVTDENQQTSSYDFTARASEASGEAADSGLVWTRTPAGGSDETTAQVLIGQTAEYVVMVSFLGGEEVAGEEFTTMAEQILEAAQAGLGS